MPKRLRLIVGVLLVLVANTIFNASFVYADPPLQSPNYRFDESAVGAGGMLNASSANYQATSSTGNLGVGDSSSSNFNVSAGTVTTADPRLAVTVGGGTDLGAFNPSAATVGTMTFSVLNYSSFGYVVNITGTPPTSQGHVIAPMAPATPPPYNETSTPGFEQFGINLVANTAPTSVGANPDHGQFGFGAATDYYNDDGRFRYVSGETIASAPKSSGITTYTITYLVNVGALTPGGNYVSNQTIVVTGTY